MNVEYKNQQKDYKLRNKINGSTTENDVVEKYEELKAIQEKKEAEKANKKK